MNKKLKSIIFALFLLCATVSVVDFTSFSRTPFTVSATTSFTVSTQQMPDGYLIFWEPVAYAEWYSVFLNDTEISTRLKDTKYILDFNSIPKGQHSVVIVSSNNVISDKVNFTNYAKLTNVIGVSIQQNILNWQSVKNADFYSITINSIHIANVDCTQTLSLDLKKFCKANCVYEISLTAKSKSPSTLASAPTTISHNFLQDSVSVENLSAVYYNNNYYAFWTGVKASYVVKVIQNGQILGSALTQNNYLNLSSFITKNGVYNLRVSSENNENALSSANIFVNICNGIIKNIPQEKETNEKN